MSGARTSEETLGVLARYFRWIVAATAVGLLVGAVSAIVATPVYRADVSVVVLPVASTEGGSEVKWPLQMALGTWVYVFGDASTFERVAQELPEYSDGEIEHVRVSVRPVDNSMVVRIAVRAEGAALATDFAATMFDVAESSTLGGVFPIARLAPLTSDAVREWPRPARSLLFGGTAGLLAGVALSFFAASRSREHVATT